ncbi:hypothetical protein CRYUN_Cryun17cG0130600 [Craigia yunnanensis]
MANTLGCSASCTDVRNPIKLSSGCSIERYLMRQRYLRSYPLMTKKEEKAENVAKRTNKWLKKRLRKYCRSDDQGNKQTGQSGRNNKSKPNPGSSYLKPCLKLLLVCVAKVDVRMENPKPAGFGIKKM